LGVNMARGAMPALGAALSHGMPYPVILSGIAMALGIGAIASLLSTISALRAPVAHTLREVA